MHGVRVAAMDLADLALNLRADGERFTNAVHEAEYLTVVDLLETADRHSSGGLTERDLQDLDRPFAKRHGAPLLDPGEINERTGTFRGNWTPVEPVQDGNDLASGLYNADPKAPYLEQPDGGPNSSMFARPIDEKIIAEVEPRRVARIEAALNELF